MGIYEELGIRRVINGNATLTRLGGSIMPREVVEAMVEASQAFVDIIELQQKVGVEIARLTRNQAAYVSSGAAAGLVLSTAACITGMDPKKREQLPHLDGLKNEVIVHRSGRVGYDYAVRQVGVTLVEIGSAEGTTAADLEAAINERTAAIFYFHNVLHKGILPLKEGIQVAKRYGVPLIVDAAAQLPPVDNLWTFTGMGADLVLFSGGKGLCGPQSAGLILGRKDLIEACAFNGSPNPFIGRPMKVGKEEMVGMLAAVRWYLRQDHVAILAAYEGMVRYFIEALSPIPGVTVQRSFPSEAGQPMPRAEITFDPQVLGLNRNQILAALREGEPSIELAAGGHQGILINPQTLLPGEEGIILKRLQEILSGASGGGKKQ